MTDQAARSVSDLEGSTCSKRALALGPSTGVPRTSSNWISMTMGQGQGRCPTTTRCQRRKRKPLSFFGELRRLEQALRSSFTAAAPLGAEDHQAICSAQSHEKLPLNAVHCSSRMHSARDRVCGRDTLQNDNENSRLAWIAAPTDGNRPHVNHASSSRYPETSQRLDTMRMFGNAHRLSLRGHQSRLLFRTV
jgi:hypothetical protein